MASVYRQHASLLLATPRPASSIGEWAEMSEDFEFPQDPPRSPVSLEQGCLCPAAENKLRQGRTVNGVSQPLFSADIDCPMHGLVATFRINVDEWR